MATTSAFGELMEAKGVLLPTVLSVVFVVSLYLVAAAGQNRLSESNSQIRAAEFRATKLVEFTRYMADAETAVRGYVITGDRSYLEPLETARSPLASTLNDLAQVYDDVEGRAQVATLQRLSDTNLGLLDQVVDRRAAGYEAASLLIRANVGKRTMDQLRVAVDAISAIERRKLEQAQNRANSDAVQGRWLLALGAFLNVLLVMLAGMLISRDLRRRSQLAAVLEDQRQSLELKVRERTAELATLSTNLQNVSEQERSSLARELHDELGSLLVAARMDLSWLQRRLPTDDASVKLRWDRIQDSLDAGVNLKRRVVEQLRPTLLDNMGLYAALRWQLQDSCGRAGLRCTEKYPDTEPPLTEAASIAIFRVVQEATTNVLKHAKAKSLDLAVEIDEARREFIIRITDDGIGIRKADPARSPSSTGLASMRHRIVALGGTWEFEPGADRGTVMTARLPLDNLLAAPVMPSIQSEAAQG